MVALSVLDIVKTKEGAKNGKPWKMVTILVEEASTKQQHKASLFVHDNLIPKVGTEIEADMEVTPEGYKNIKKWREIGIKEEVKIFTGTKVQTHQGLAGTWLMNEKDKKITSENIQKINTKEMSKEEWANKDLVGNYGKCVMYASGCFVPRTNEDGIEPLDRAMAICDLAEAIFLQRMYNFNLKDLKAKI